MQPIPQTELIIKTLKEAISFIEMIRLCDEFYLSLIDFDKIATENFITCYHSLNFDLSFVEEEFWETCENIDQIQLYKRIFEVKFAFILDWRPEFDHSDKEFFKQFRKEHEPFIAFIKEQQGRLSEDDFTSLKHQYYSITYRISDYKTKIKALFNEWEQMSVIPAKPTIQKLPNNSEKEAINPQNNTPQSSKFRLATKRKTDFLKIISAMYDCRMFETENGYIASNKQELLNEFGHLLSEDFSKYSSSLSQSKQVTKETFLKPFDDIRKKAEEYYEK